MRAPTKVYGRNPKEEKDAGGDTEVVRGLIASPTLADHRTGQDLEVDAPGAGASASWQEPDANGEEG